MAGFTQSFDDVKIDGPVNITTFNAAVQKLVDNDSSLIAGSTRPGIWECTWFNLRGSRSSVGYSKGDAVWLNTEDVNVFVKAHENDLYAYLKGFSDTTYLVDQLAAEPDKTALYQLYASFITGENTYDDAHKHIYFVGQLSGLTQIRISTSDFNTALPTDNRYWKDFIRRDLDDDYYINQMLSVAENAAADSDAKHLQTYHLSGLVGPGCRYATADEYAGRFMKKDWSNLETSHKFVSHDYSKDLTGVDFIKESACRDFDDGNVRWFRLWNSGYLEHGGTINLKNLLTSDCLRYEDSYLSVSLEWQVSSGVISPSYDYKHSAMAGFYQTEDYVFVNEKNTSCLYEAGTDDLTPSQRYTVCVTPSLFGSTLTPYSQKSESIQTLYTSNEVTMLRNSGFAFKLTPQISSYFYSVAGFTVQ